jgi:hypothetical protein
VPRTAGPAKYKIANPPESPARGTRLAVASSVQLSSRSPTKVRRILLVILLSKCAEATVNALEAAGGGEHARLRSMLGLILEAAFMQIHGFGLSLGCFGLGQTMDTVARNTSWW